VGRFGFAGAAAQRSYRRLRSQIRRRNAQRPRTSYAQCGEDLIVDYIFKARHLERPTYLDIGANHPTELSNTYLFYRRGCHGICVEPDPDLFQRFQRRRPRDRCLNVGVGTTEQQTASFYLMNPPGLNTFSEADAARLTESGMHSTRGVAQIPLRTINELLSECVNGDVDFLSMDIEGLEFEVLRTLDFSRFRPKVICVETLIYTGTLTGVKMDDTARLLQCRGYYLYADTFLNSIFVEDSFFRGSPPAPPSYEETILRCGDESG